MCLAVPGQVVEVGKEAGGSPRAGTRGDMRMAKVDFQGSRVAASLIFTPEARVGDWVLVHAGFAIRKLDEREARETWKYLDSGALEELGPAVAPQGGA